MNLPKVPLRLMEGLNQLRRGINQFPPPPSRWKVQRLTDRELEAYLALCYAFKERNGLEGNDLDEYLRLSELMLDPARDALVALRNTSARIAHAKRLLGAVA